MISSTRLTLVRALSRDALIHRVRFADVRRAPVRRFKFYGVYYVVQEQEVWVIAICKDDGDRSAGELWLTHAEYDAGNWKEK